MSLKQKTINGLVWSFIESFSKQGINFIIGIILARLLLPEEFGLIGMIAVFIAISTSLINSGFTQALIRKKDCTDTDYSTVFYFNLIVGILLALSLFFAAPYIELFFDEPQLNSIVKVFSVVLIFDAFSIIQRTQLIKRIDFKLQTKITLIADVASGIVAIIMAYYGFGVWSLVVKQLIGRGLHSILLWFCNKWMPNLIFSKSSFKELFGFGSKLMLSGLFSSIFQNIYLLFIGKFFSAADLGFYTRADQFKKLPSQNINSAIQRVTFPVLSELQDDIPRLKSTFRQIMRSAMFITAVLMIGLGAVSESLILTLLGSKWSESIPLLQLLVFTGILYPMHSLNLNILKVYGYSGRFLRLEILKRVLVIPAIALGFFYGIKWMIVCIIANNLIAYFMNSFWSVKLINYSSIQQLKDILPSLSVAIVMGIIVCFFDYFINFNPLLELILQILIGSTFIIVYSEVTNFSDYIYIKKTLLKKFRKVR
ncbi:lipopolysaccharide biosynthesis protein [Psychroserpens sp.]|uniref:lipopolysaccharide biosynthesis protein n=1 Tax=Psychroserpens sp. TaxID=2020870 RepID=UPI0038594F93